MYVQKMQVDEIVNLADILASSTLILYLLLV